MQKRFMVCDKMNCAVSEADTLVDAIDNAKHETQNWGGPLFVYELAGAVHNNARWRPTERKAKKVNTTPDLVRIRVDYPGESKINIIRELRAQFDLSLKDAKEMSEGSMEYSPPIPRYDAVDIIHRLYETSSRSTFTVCPVPK